MLKLLFIAYLAGQAFDGATTVYAFRHGFVEGNPAMAWAPAHPVLFVGFKTGVSGSAAWAAFKLHEKQPKRATIIMAVVAGVTWTAAMNNMRQLRR